MICQLYVVHRITFKLFICKIQGIESVSELAFAIHKRLVLCFVRHFDTDYQGQKDDKYSVVKVYTIVELVQINLVITNEVALDPIGGPTPTAAAKSEKVANTTEELDLIAKSIEQHTTEGQFFSPTTKMILDSIAQKSDVAKTPTKKLNF